MSLNSEKDSITLPSFDWGACMQLCNQKKDLANSLLTQFIEELPSFQKIFQKAVADKDYQTLYDQAHKLRGSCQYCGVPKLNLLLEELESAIRKNISENFESLIQSINHEIFEITKLIKEHL